MKSSILLIITLLVAGSVFSQTKTVSGATFKSQMDIKGTKLMYNGAGLREKYTIDLYVAALYLPNQTMNGTTVINANEVQAIELKIVSNKVTREKFNDTVKEGFAKVSEGKASAEEISKFTGFFSAELKDGDAILIIYKPGKGTAVMVNGKYKGLVEGLEFKKALFSIWLGATPADKKLKSKMLGKV
ncbi:MAG: hypothetical protein ACJASQ_003289 [Crocinitomicaceae bacterium]|jgi:hypothetical protein